jgi:hypothetical protein
MDVLNGNSALLRLGQQRATDQFGAIVHPNGQGLSSPFNDAVQCARHPLRR